MSINKAIKRCKWVTEDPLYIKYHDNEWGKPTHDDRTLFEFLVLESAQAGLSWITILRKRENYRKAYDDFDVEKVSKYTEDKIEELSNYAGIIRNRRKITASINNAKRFIEVQKEFGTFDQYIWGFTNGQIIVGNWEKDNEVPCETALSSKVAKDMKQRGFTFVGETIMYSYMQAVGILNDHINSCAFK